MFLLFLPFQPLPPWLFLLLSYPIFILLVIFCLSQMLLIKFPFESLLPLAACNLAFICEMTWSLFYFFHEFNQLSFHFFLWLCLFLFLIFVFLTQDRLSYPQMLLKYISSVWRDAWQFSNTSWLLCLFEQGNSHQLG